VNPVLAEVNLEVPLPVLVPAQPLGDALVNSSVAGPGASGDALVNSSVAGPGASGMLADVVHLIQWTPDTFPNPREDARACGLEKVGLICDPDLLLKPTTRSAIQENLEHLGKELRCVLAVAVCRDVAPTGDWQPWVGVGARVDHLAETLLVQWSGRTKEGPRSPDVILAVATDRDYVSIQLNQHKRECDGLHSLSRSISAYGVQPYVDNDQLDKGLVSGIEEIAAALREPEDSIAPLGPTKKKFVVLCGMAISLAVLMIACGCCCSSQEASTALATPQEI